MPNGGEIWYIPAERYLEFPSPPPSPLWGEGKGEGQHLRRELPHVTRKYLIIGSKNEERRRKWTRI